MAKKSRRKEQTKPAVSGALDDAVKSMAESASLVDAVSSNLPDYPNLLGGAAAELPDYRRLVDAVSKLPDYANLMGGAAANLPDFARLIGDASSKLPDYANLMGGAAANLPDFARLLDAASWKLPDYANSMGGAAANLPDFARLIDAASWKLPDYANPMGGAAANLPDFARLIDAASWKLPDYANPMGGAAANLPDFARLIDTASWKLPDYTTLMGPATANLSDDVTRFAATNLLRDLASRLPPTTENSVPASVDHVAKLREEIDTLRQNAAEQFKALSLVTSGSEKQKQEIERLQKTVDELNEKQRLGFLLERVHPDAHRHLRESHEFQDKFLATGECSAFVLSVDIRRSTELMLKARTAEQFAEFMRRLCIELTRIVVNSLGVFDKFTGDGVLAFFPDFYSGPDAAFRVVAAADQCHAAFQRHYREARTSFKSVLTEVGLGIGVDHGSVRLVQVAGGLTVVGEPVVYACRLSSGPPNVTLANQPAFEQVIEHVGGLCFTQERSHDIKHEGAMLAYEVRLNGREHVPAPPEWLIKSAPADEPRQPQSDEEGCRAPSW